MYATADDRSKNDECINLAYSDATNISLFERQDRNMTIKDDSEDYYGQKDNMNKNTTPLQSKF